MSQFSNLLTCAMYKLCHDVKAVYLEICTGVINYIYKGSFIRICCNLKQ